MPLWDARFAKTAFLWLAAPEIIWSPIGGHSYFRGNLPGDLGSGLKAGSNECGKAILGQSPLSARQAFTPRAWMPMVYGVWYSNQAGPVLHQPKADGPPRPLR